jgi:phenylacetate-coenzyme A ligase PaaK-like adenylate-forming protein
MGYRHNESFFSILDPICYLGRDSTTNLYNKTFPIIKYQNEDLFEFIDDHTINPFTKIKLKNLRANDIITVINNYGEEISIKPYLIDCFEVEGMDAFQFCKMENNTLLIKISGKKEGLEKKGLNAAMDLLKVHQAEKSVKVKILIMDSIPLDPKTGKHRMVIP